MFECLSDCYDCYFCYLDPALYFSSWGYSDGDGPSEQPLVFQHSHGKWPFTHFWLRHVGPTAFSLPNWTCFFCFVVHFWHFTRGKNYSKHQTTRCVVHVFSWKKWFKSFLNRAGRHGVMFVLRKASCGTHVPVPVVPINNWSWPLVPQQAEPILSGWWWWTTNKRTSTTK